jgi:hypothetical protein
MGRVGSAKPLPTGKLSGNVFYRTGKVFIASAPSQITELASNGSTHPGRFAI